MAEYELKRDFGMSSVVAETRRRMEEDDNFVNESISDILKTTTLAALLAIPGLVDAKDIAKGISSSSGDNKVVKVSSPKVQKKIYDIVGKDRYDDAVLVNVLARTLMAEAVGEKSTDSFDAVASVIWNRSGGDKNKFISTIFAPSQFSCWNGMTQSDKTNFVIKPHGRALTNPTAWNYCVTTAKKMVDGTFVPTGAWKYYYAHNKVTPSWASKLMNKKVIGNHTFGTI
jgi:hypothetical protein